MYTKFKYILIFSISFLTTHKSIGFNRSLFYRVSSFWGEPRLEKNFLTTIDTTISGGRTRIGLNCNKKKTNLFSLYGPEIFNLNSETEKFTFAGKLKIFQTDFNIYQNLCNGFFWHFHLPIISTNISATGCTKKPKIINLKNCNTSFSDQQLNDLTSLLNQNNLSLNSVNDNGLSDSTLFWGWTINYENTEYLDFVDFTAKLGVLFPSGKEKDELLLFDFPYGYNQHWGIPWSFDIAIGAYEWLTLGLHTDGVGLINKKRETRIRTEEALTGLIRLKNGKAEIKSGPVWRTGGYFKADHFCWGLSILMGFSYEQKNRSEIRPFNKTQFDPIIANNDEQLKKWNRWIYHLIIEYDLSSIDYKYNPRLSINYNHQISGKRVFKTNMLGGNLGIDFVLGF